MVDIKYDYYCVAHGINDSVLALPCSVYRIFPIHYALDPLTTWSKRVRREVLNPGHNLSPQFRLQRFQECE